MTLTTLALTESVKAHALALGFDRVAVGPAGPADHASRFEQWLDAGYAAGMDYLARTRAERGDPGRLLPGCRSVVAVALAYGPREDDPSWAPVSRYARGGDYHELMRARLLALAAHLREAGGSSIESRAAVDTSAVLERDLAARSGLGWIGKNTNLIAPGGGSYFFIGVVLTTAALAPDEALADHCGTCTACLDACPTGAFVEPHVLDASRCLAYLTIEHRGDDPRRVEAGDERVALRLRRLPGSVPVEPQGAARARARAVALGAAAVAGDAPDDGRCGVPRALPRQRDEPRQARGPGPQRGAAARQPR